MRRYAKPLVVVFSLLAALFLTIYRQGPDGGIGVTANRPLGAAPERKQRAEHDLGALRVFNSVLMKIKDNYVEPKRIDPKKMLVAALDAVEKTVAEVLVEELPGKDVIHVRVDSRERKFDVSGVDSPWALGDKLRPILRFIQSHMRQGTSAADVEYAAVNGMLSTLDPHSLLLKPELYNEMKLSTRGEFGGLGIVISMVQGVLTVINPMKGTPADVAGIKACDQILKIGEESTVNMTLTQAVSRLRGPPASRVEVTLMRPGWSGPVRKTLTRAVIKVPSVKNARLLGKSKIGYVQLSSFQGNTYDDLRESLADLRRKGMKALILDLRNDPGGLLDQAIKISDLFIDSGTLLTTVGHAGKHREEKRARLEGTEPRYPMAVIVNSGSASASEIVAGALKNLDRAVVIGSRTFGKGTVQVLYDNEDGSALKLTIAEYLTPGDVSIQAVGITPDIGTAPVVIRKNFIRLVRADHSRREKDLRRHLSQRPAADANPVRTLLYLADNPEAESEIAGEEDEEDSEGGAVQELVPGEGRRDKNLCLYPDRDCKPTDEEKFVEDFQIRVARDLLSRARVWRRSQILGGTPGFFEHVQGDEDRRIAAALKDLGVDWSRVAPAAAGQPRIRVAVAMDPASGTALACRESRVRVTVRNDGDAPTRRLMAVSSSTNKIFEGHEFVFGAVEPRSSRTWEVPISVRDAPSREDEVTLKFQEENGFAPEPYTFPVGIRGVPRPTFAYGYQLIDDVAGNEDGRVQRGEQARLLVKVRNTGKGAAFRTIGTLKNLSGEGIFLRKGRFVLGPLAPGETKSASFTFDVDKSFAEPSFKLEMLVFDEALRESVSEKLEFNISRGREAPAGASGTVRVSAEQAELRAWGAADAPLVGHAPRGTSLPLTGRTQGWLRVLAAPDRPAFVEAASVSPVSTSALPQGAAAAQRFTPHYHVTPPRLVVKAPTLSTLAESITIEGVATDETRVSDLYVFVSNPEGEGEHRKVFYRSNAKAARPTELRFSTQVPLWPGANYITVYARENDDVQAKETLVVVRRQAAVAKGEPKAAGRKAEKRGERESRPAAR